MIRNVRIYTMFRHPSWWKAKVLRWSYPRGPHRRECNFAWGPFHFAWTRKSDREWLTAWCKGEVGHGQCD